MIERRLIRQLERVASRLRQRRLYVVWSLVWLATAAMAWGLLAANVTQGVYLPRAVAGLSLLAAFAAACAGWLVTRSVRDYTWLAQLVERAYPDLKSGLLAAVHQRPEGPNGRLGFMQQRVVDHVLQHAYAHTWRRVAPPWQVATALLANLACFAVLIAALGCLAMFAAPRPIAARTLNGQIEKKPAGGDYRLTVEPGATEVERGTSLLVLARFEGPLPPDARLVYTPIGGEPAQTAMLKSLDDPVFGARIPEVNGELDYHVEFADASSESFRVTVFEYPRLLQADAELEFPSYTGLETKRIADTRRVAAVEGTQLALICRLNKPVASARLVSEEGDLLTLVAAEPGETAAASGEPAAVPAADNLASGEPAGTVYVARWKLERSQRFKLELIDAQDRRNKQPPEFVITVLPNKPPDLKLVAPARDLQVSPLEELDVLANVWDDYGVGRFGVQYSIAGEEPREVVLAESIGGRQREEVRHTVAFEELEAQPDQLLSYHFWAEDAGPDGQPRRTFSDMYFAEVRHFEEIFRQGQQPPGSQQQQQQQQGNAAQAEQLAELQKQIINATWTVVRRESGSAVSEKFSADVQLIVDSQRQAIEQALEMGQQLQDEQSKEFLADAQAFMQGAVEHLSEATDLAAPQPLQTALAAEQSAYQVLLKLRAREHEVVQSSQSSSSSSSSSSSRSQQQLQQLQLSEDENRYETENTARREQDQQDREIRQVLNRLRELARRQADLNERLKELNAALEEATTEKEREEIRQQLKRLREEQQQIMRDAEELESRMQQPENQERMNEAQQRLSETRENLRQASEALEQGQTSRAITSGTRAERQFEELRDEFRQAASNRFEEEMREMRDRAAELDENQQQLSERIAEAANPRERETPSLRSTDDREQIENELAEQRERLAELLNQMAETVTQAEATEPLLANTLYDSIRQAQQRDLERALQATESSLRTGLMQDAQQLQRVAQEGIQELRSGVERAADAVLGDETEALRRAQQELNNLVDQLQAEADRANPEAAERRRQEEAQAAAQASDQPGGERSADGQPGAPETPGRSPASDPQGDRRQPPNAGQSPGKSPGQSPGQEDQPATADEARQDAEVQREGRSGRSPAEPTGDPSRDDGEPRDEPSSDSQSRDAQSRDSQSGNSQSGQASPGRGESQSESSSPGQQPGGQSPSGQSPSGSQPRSTQQAGSESPRDAARSRGGQPGRLGGLERLLEQGGMTGGNGAAPITGADYREWTDRLRDVEEMVGDPELSAEAARVRDRVRGFRQEFRRHSQEPNWDLVQMQVIEPLVELRDRVANEVLKRSSDEALVPIDRDPVPPRFEDPVRRYFERLGTGR